MFRKIIRNIILKSLILWIGTLSGVYAAVLKSLDVLPNGTKAEVRLNLNSDIQAKVFKLANPDRIVIDLPYSSINPSLARQLFKGAYRIRVGQPEANVVRVVIESSASISYQVIKSSGALLIIMVQSAATSGPVAISVPSKTWVPVKKKIVVVIDPGHGGKDPGAFGYYRTPEKQVVLAIAKRLKHKIDSQPGMQAVLTRDGDYFIDLRRRLDISRRYHPDIFVAIHADAFSNPQSHGASVFALSQTGATSEAARWLAEKENYSELAGVNLKDLDDQNGMVRSVLIDLSQTATIQASLKVGQNVLGYLGRMTSLHNHRVEQARFVVLKSPDTPSLLVETGFISNPLEERRLTSVAYQEQLSQAIFNGIHQYFQENPPRGH